MGVASLATRLQNWLILRMTRWNKETFCMLVQFQESYKLLQLLLGGHALLVHKTLKSTVS